MTKPASRNNDRADSRIDFELKKHLCVLLYQTANRTSRFYGRLLAPYGLTFPQFQVLIALQGRTQCTVGALCTALDLDTSTITAVLKRLEAQGFVFRFRDRIDERRVFVVLTEKGRAFETDSQRIRASYAERTGLSEGEMSTLRRTLEALSSALEPALA